MPVRFLKILAGFNFAVLQPKGQKGTIMNYTNNPIIIGIDHGYGNIKVFSNALLFHTVLI